MIVRKDKTFETNKMFPNANFYPDEDNFVVDETTDQGKQLADKISRLHPYFDFVLNPDGQLVDVVEIPRPPEPPQAPSIEERTRALEDAMTVIMGI